MFSAKVHFADSDYDVVVVKTHEGKRSISLVLGDGLNFLSAVVHEKQPNQGGRIRDKLAKFKVPVNADASVSITALLESGLISFQIFEVLFHATTPFFVIADEDEDEEDEGADVGSELSGRVLVTVGDKAKFWLDEDSATTLIRMLLAL
jgi:hypothetical protein